METLIGHALRRLVQYLRVLHLSIALFFRATSSFTSAPPPFRKRGLCGPSRCGSIGFESIAHLRFALTRPGTYTPDFDPIAWLTLSPSFSHSPTDSPLAPLSPLSFTISSSSSLPPSPSSRSDPPCSSFSEKRAATAPSRAPPGWPPWGCLMPPHQ